MSDQIILQPLDDSEDAERILDEFERVTGFEADIRHDGRYYDLEGEDHATKVVHVLTEIDEEWTAHIGLKMPG